MEAYSGHWETTKLYIRPVVLKCYKSSESPGWLLKIFPRLSGAESRRVDPLTCISNTALGNRNAIGPREHILKVKSRCISSGSEILECVFTLSEYSCVSAKKVVMK